MAIPANPESTAGRAGADEGALHFFARESQTFLLWSVFILLGVTIVTMVVFFPAAIIPASLLILAYGLLMVTNVIERRSNRAIHPSTGESMREDAGAPDVPATTASAGTVAQEEASDEPVNEYEKPWAMGLLRHETLVVSIGILAVLILAIVLAATRFGGMALVVAVFFLFAYIVLLTAPVWMAALEDDIEDVSHR